MESMTQQNRTQTFTGCDPEPHRTTVCFFSDPELLVLGWISCFSLEGGDVTNGFEA